jgi:hypothetical protein
MNALPLVEYVFAAIGVVTSLAFVRFHVQQFLRGVREGQCERTGHVWRPWLRRCKACGCEEPVQDVPA